MSNSLQPYGLKHARLPCPSPAPEASSNSYPFESVMPSNHLILPWPLFSSYVQSFPPSGSFPMSRFFAPGCQRIGVQLQHQFYQWILRTDFLLDGVVGYPCKPRDSQESSPTPQFKSINSLALSFFIVQISHLYMTTAKTIALTRRTFVSRVMSLLFNMLSTMVITFLLRSKCLLISCLQ